MPSLCADLLQRESWLVRPPLSRCCNCSFPSTWAAWGSLIAAEGEKRLKKLEKALGTEGIEFRPESYKWSIVQVGLAVWLAGCLPGCRAGRMGLLWAIEATMLWCAAAASAITWQYFCCPHLTRLAPPLPLQALLSRGDRRLTALLLLVREYGDSLGSFRRAFKELEVGGCLWADACGWMEVVLDTTGWLTVLGVSIASHLMPRAAAPSCPALPASSGGAASHGSLRQRPLRSRDNRCAELARR